MSIFTHSRLIWRKKKDRSRNRYLAFQKEFHVRAVPSEARLHISAYAYYQVAINGVVLGRGPDPSNHRRYYYDTYDVRSCLRRGRNVINVLAYAFGPRLPWPETSYLPGEYGWLQFELEYRTTRGRSVYVGSDSDCRVRSADAWSRHAPGYTELRAAYKEYYDARRFGYEALSPSNTRSRPWRRAVELLPCDLKYEYTFHPKETKPFEWRDRFPAAAYTIDGGFAYGFTAKRGWQIENPEALVPGYPVEQYYEIGRQGEPNFPRRRVEADPENRCMIRKSPGCGAPSLWVDFGGMQYGTLHVELETGAPGTVIDIGYGESPHITYVDRYTTRKGRQVFTPYHFRAGRYVMLTFSKMAGPVVLRDLRFRRCDCAVRPNPNPFASSSGLLNRIEIASINTLRLNMHSHFEDCPWREQKMYLGDMYVEALACYYLWGEYDYMRKNLTQMAVRNRADGWISSGPGCVRGGSLIVDFPVHFIVELRDYYLFSGDRKNLAALYPYAVRVLENYLNMGLLRKGLVDIGKADSFANWCVINWNDVVKKGECAPLNFLVLRGLCAAIEMAEWLDLAEDRIRFLRIVKPFRRAINDAFWSSSRGMYRDGRYRGKPIEHYSTETNTLALLSGLPDASKTRRITKALEKGPLSMETPTAYFNAFVAEGLFRSGRARTALHLIETYWGRMLDRDADAFWEIFLPQTPPRSHPPKSASLCHGWASGPAYLFPAYVLGIRPLAPGFERFSVDPKVLALDFVSASVPSPHGVIEARYESGTLSLSHPRRTTPVISNTPGLPPGTGVVIRER